MSAYTDDDRVTTVRRGAAAAAPGATARRWCRRAVRTGMRRRYGLPALLLGPAAVVIGIVLIVTAPGGPRDAGAIPVATGPVHRVQTTTSPLAGTLAPGAKPAPGQATQSLAPLPAITGPLPSVAPPTRLVIPKIGVNAPVVESSVKDDGGLDIPADASQVGWWNEGSVPGSTTGTIVLAGHVDLKKTGPGALFQLQKLPLGEAVTVSTEDRDYVYRVVARRSYPKQSLPQTVFDQDGVNMLVLVTCGGKFSNGHYADNVVVYATPVNDLPQ